MFRRAIVSAAAALSLGLGATGALADDGSAPTPAEVKKVSFTITSKQCADLPQGVTIKGSGTSRKYTTFTTDASGVNHYFESVFITGTATDNRGGRYRFDYHHAWSSSSTTPPYVAFFTDHFDIVPRGAFGGGLHTFFAANVTVKSEDPFEAVFDPIVVHGDPTDFKTLKSHCDPL
jgi:hypothetical protein